MSRSFRSFEDVPMFSYDFIMADPNWQFETYSAAGHEKAAQAHYDCMSVDKIAALPVGQMASRDCVLWLWATNPMLPEALQVLSAWGFKFKTAGTWVKMSKSWTPDCDDPKQAFGTGYILRSANEPFLIGTMGDNTTSRSVRSAIIAAVREHSRKPDEAFHAAEMLMPDARRIELFSRQDRPGWDTAGHEVGKFNKEQCT